MKVCVVLFVSVGTPLLSLLALAQQVTVDFGSTAPTTQTTSSQKTQNSQQSTSAEAVPPSAKRLLTNADVVRMIKAGLAESTILLAIEQNPSKFDTAPAALIDLKEQGVPPAIVEAMMRTGSPPSTNDEASAPRPLVNDTKANGAELLAEGTYYKGPTGWIRLEQITMAGGGAKHVGKMFVPGLTPQIVWTFRGASAELQIADRKPVFYVRQSPYMANVPGRSERDAVIVRFDRKKDHRELQTTSGGSAFTFKAGFSKERTPDITVTRISETTFAIRPNAELPAGEYLLTFGGLGASGFDFGIRPGK